MLVSGANGWMAVDGGNGGDEFRELWCEDNSPDEVRGYVESIAFAAFCVRDIIVKWSSSAVYGKWYPFLSDVSDIRSEW